MLKKLILMIFLLVLSGGCFSSKKEDVISEMKKTGFTIEKIVEKDEWVSIVGRS